MPKLEPYETVRIVRLLETPETYNGWGVNQRSPRVGDTGAILDVLTAPGLPNKYVVEKSGFDGVDIWLADFWAEELELLSDQEGAVLAAQHRFWAALRSKDAALFEQVLAPEFVARAPGEAPQDRAAFVAGLLRFPGQILYVGSDDLTVDFVGEAAVVTGLQRARVRLPDGQEVENVLALTNVFRREGEGWVMVIAHPVELK